MRKKILSKIERKFIVSNFKHNVKILEKSKHNRMINLFAYYNFHCKFSRTKTDFKYKKNI